MSKFIDTDRDGVDDNQDVDKIKSGSSRFGQMVDNYFGDVDKDDSLTRGLVQGLATDQIGKTMDAERTEQQATFQSGMFKDNSKFGADLQYDFDAKTRADEFGYGMRSLDKQFNLQDEFQNRQFGRNIGMEQAQGEQRRKDLKETGAQARETYDFQDTVDARGEERNRGRANRLARSF